MTNKQIEKLTGLEVCEFNDECDYCDDPKGVSFASMSHCPEDNSEVNYYVCKKCIEKHPEGWGINHP